MASVVPLPFMNPNCMSPISIHDVINAIQICLFLNFTLSIKLEVYNVTCKLTAKNQDQLWNPTLSSQVWATFYYL